MRLFRLTLFTLFLRKSWVICALAVLVAPFAFAQMSIAAESPALLKPALAQATWAAAWLCAIFWGFFAASNLGQSNARSGTGEYFQSQGLSPTRQLFEIWLSVFVFVAPLGLAAALVCSFFASPSLTDERAMWISNNLQYAILFCAVIAPLLALAVALASRFGSIIAFVATSGICLYGLYGVGYMKLFLGVESSRVLAWLWTLSPHYHLADPMERLRYKLGAIEWSEFPLLLGYFFGIALLHVAASRLIFRTRAA